MDIGELTLNDIGRIKSMTLMDETSTSPYILGKNYFIRTVTHYFTGTLEAVYPSELVISNAAWIADTGRFGEMLRTGSMKELEPYPDGSVIIGRGAVIDASIIEFDLPREAV